MVQGVDDHCRIKITGAAWESLPEFQVSDGYDLIYHNLPRHG